MRRRCATKIISAPTNPQRTPPSPSPDTDRRTTRYVLEATLNSTILGGSHSAFCGLKQTPTRLRSTGRPAPLVRSVQGVPPWLKSGSNERHASTAALGLRPSILWTHRETWRVPRAHRSVRLGKSATLRMLAGIETGRSRPHRLRFDRASRNYGTIETSPATRGTHGRWWRSTWASR